jgi:enhancing lycopene biosynthesis protein 2
MTSILDNGFAQTSVLTNEQTTGGTTIDATTDVTCKSVIADTITATTSISVNETTIKDNTIMISAGNDADTVAGSLSFEHKSGSIYHTGFIKKPNSDDIIVFKPTTTSINGSTNVDTLLRGNLIAGTIKTTNLSSETGTVTITNTADTSATNVGAVVISGGVGVAKSLSVGGTLRTSSLVSDTGTVTISNTANTSETNVGALVVSGGVGIAKSLCVGGDIRLRGAGSIYSADSGGLQYDQYGNMRFQSTAPAGNAFAIVSNANGGSANMVQVKNNSGASPAISILATVDATNQTTAGTVITGGLAVSKSVMTGGTIKTFNTVDATSSTTGAMICTGGLGVSKNTYIGDGLYLPSAGGTASKLNYYEEYAHSTTFTGIWASPPSKTVKITRFGRIVTLMIPPTMVTSNTSAVVTMGTVLPPRFRPASGEDASGACLAIDNGTAVHGCYRVMNDGSLTITNGITLSTAFSGTGIAGFDGFAVTYSL